MFVIGLQKMISRFRLCIAHTTFENFRSYSRAREARILRKMINRGLAPKNVNINKNKIITHGFFLSPHDVDNHSHRVAALNKMYMEHINDLIHNSKFSQQLDDLKIQVTKVRIAKECNFLNIYIIVNNTDTPEDTINQILNGALAELQAKIGELRYIGKVPFLKFVRDKALENAIQVDRVFQIADFGTNYQPKHEKKVCTQEFSKREDGIPDMRENVLGLDVGKIKKKIEADILRFKAINIEEPEKDMDNKDEFPQKLMKFSKSDFIKFFKKRRIAYLKRRKLEERLRPVIEFDIVEDDEYYEDDEDNIYEEDFRNND